ncbi:DNA-methyltransferase [Microbacterium sp. A1-JK]|uniref:DNA-methyltransferase n=1 Tax=Microbacterium sp. A1-JK TaxID=3177516 RepID=UPI003887CD0B
MEAKSGHVHQPLPTVAVGDAFDRVAVLAPASVDCVVTSPPYWGLRSYGHVHDEEVLEKWASAHPSIDRRDLPSHAPGYDWYRSNGGVLGLEPYPQWFVGHLVEIFERLKPALKASASIWVNLGDTYFARWSSIRSDGRQGLGAGGRTRRKTPSGGELIDKQLLLIPARFAIAMQEAGWILRNDVIWAKTGVPPRANSDRLRLSHEHFFHFVLRPSSGRAKYYYDASVVEPGANDVVRVASHRGSDGHSATFPKDLVRPRIESSCPPGGLLLDPFCGTGRALEAAVESGRRAHGIELSTAYAQAARRRVREAKERRILEDPKHG